MTKHAKNILFIMYDQLRWDYLSCAGHPHLQTPHMDSLAAKGVRFNRAYVQSPVCGASRMSFYTGRYVQSHGAAWNNFPLKVGEMTLGDHLRPLGMNAWLVGKTHMRTDVEGMARLGLSPDSVIGARVAECGFDIFERDDGMRPEGPDGFYDPNGALNYNEYLRSKGYVSDNPWHDFANSGVTDAGDIASGWLMENADRAANIEEEDSETPYLTRRGIDFIEQAGDAPWLCHLSFIKPHWPYIVPEPYHDMYGHNQVLPANRSDAERDDPHPVYHAFQTNPIGTAFARDEVREKVIPAYMGLVKQCDDQLGVLLKYLKDSGRMDDTMIVLTSDHGDYLGDHWLGEKDLFHDCSAKVPLIIYDPSQQADSTRGTVCDALVEGIDLAPTFVEVAGGPVADHILEGRSLMPWLRGETPDWRDFVISEYDYSLIPMAARLGVSPQDARLFMVSDGRWKMMHAEGGFRPMLFDLAEDPNELTDLGADTAYADVIADMYAKLHSWARRVSQRTTLSNQKIVDSRGKSRGTGVHVGVFSAQDIDKSVAEGSLALITGKAPKRIPPA